MTKPKHHRGDVDESTGLVFLCFKSKKRKDGSVHRWERWVTPTAFSKACRGQLAASKRWRHRNPDRVFWFKQADYARNKGNILARNRVTWQKNRKKNLKRNAAYAKAHAEQIRTRRREIRRHRYATEPIYKLKRLCQRRLRLFLHQRSFVKEQTTAAMIGCTYEKLRAHLESKFKPGMTWLNCGSGWHLDHKTPLKTAVTKEDVIRLFHYTNIQPLWKSENLSKGSKLEAA